MSGAASCSLAMLLAGLAVHTQAALDALARYGVAPSQATRDALYQLYIESGSTLPFEQWVMLLASGPAYSPSVRA